VTKKEPLDDELLTLVEEEVRDLLRAPHGGRANRAGRQRHRFGPRDTQGLIVAVLKTGVPEKDRKGNAFRMPMTGSSRFAGSARCDRDPGKGALSKTRRSGPSVREDRQGPRIEISISLPNGAPSGQRTALNITGLEQQI